MAIRGQVKGGAPLPKQGDRRAQYSFRQGIHPPAAAAAMLDTLRICPTSAACVARDAAVRSYGHQRATPPRSQCGAPSEPLSHLRLLRHCTHFDLAAMRGRR